MKTLACAAVRGQLAAFHDRELTLDEEIRVSGHVRACTRCAAELAELRALGSVLRTVPPRILPSDDEASGLAVAVLAQVRVRQELTILSRLRRSFSGHVVFAGLGAAAATAACVASIVTLVGAATDQRPDSLAALVDALATPEVMSNRAFNGDIETRWNERFRQANETAEREAVFALSEAVAREDRKQVDRLLDVVSRARFEPTREAGFSALPWVAVTTTVRAAKPQPIATPINAPKRRAVAPAIPVGASRA